MAKQTSDIYQVIYELVRQVPYGRITTYGAIAKAIGTASSARLVGYAMNHAHSETPFVPAHRVVNRIGMLTGKHHFGPGKEMQEALEAEGIVIVDDKVRDFDERFWDPATELMP